MDGVRRFIDKNMDNIVRKLIFVYYILMAYSLYLYHKRPYENSITDVVCIKYVYTTPKANFANTINVANITDISVVKIDSNQLGIVKNESSDRSTENSANLRNSEIDLVFYPSYSVDMQPNISYPFVYPLQERKSDALKGKRLEIPSRFRRGIVFYVYSNTICMQDSKYLKEAMKYINRTKIMSPNSKIALVTNCDLPLYLFMLLDVIVPIHPNDIMHIDTVQFQTRVLYNSEPPFDISLVMDAHVLFCQDGDLEEMYDLFEKSSVELAYSARLLNRWVTSGFAVIYRRTPNTVKYWHHVSQMMNTPKSASDDQFVMARVTKYMMDRKELQFRWLSNNWFFATHGVNEEGRFFGSSNCYRSSVLVNGRIRFIHGRENQCQLLNGDNNKYISTVRSIYIPGNCKQMYDHAKLVTSQDEIVALVGENHAPAFNWTLLDGEDPNSLFWYSDK